MADIIGKANELAASEVDSSTAVARAQAANMPVGKPGDCELCGEWSGRLVSGVCAPCRDRRGLP